MKDQWKGYALAAVTSLLLGGTGAGMLSSNAIAEVRTELKAEIDMVKAREEKTYDVVIQLSIAVARLEEKIDAALAR